jgi:hypothetical protein
LQLCSVGIALTQLCAGIHLLILFIVGALCIPILVFGLMFRFSIIAVIIWFCGLP